jgi:hypothetical protein
VRRCEKNIAKRLDEVSKESPSLSEVTSDLSTVFVLIQRCGRQYSVLVVAMRGSYFLVLNVEKMTAHISSFADE